MQVELLKNKPHKFIEGHNNHLYKWVCMLGLRRPCNPMWMQQIFIMDVRFNSLHMMD